MYGGENDIDSGWRFHENGLEYCVRQSGDRRIRTGGINPFFQTEEEISAEIRDNLIPRIRESDSVGAVYFYGAGCAFTEKNEIIRRSVTRYLPVPVEVGSDLLAAARAFVETAPALLVFWGPVPTLVCMTERVLSRAYLRSGFVLGDEGSGAVLGKLLVGDVLKNQLPAALQEAFWAESGFDTGHHYGKGL